ncbi:unnamed protein product [Acanthosepion pharaonis]|uniref:Uncharacterized protein n=1 Tax=Acanthosepion pharaonis TaxID=158019 RepID=A0A812BFE0_ACAPH|nr:unnamed protein product [Sepia pharaonis]
MKSLFAVQVCVGLVAIATQQTTIHQSLANLNAPFHPLSLLCIFIFFFCLFLLLFLSFACLFCLSPPRRIYLILIFFLKNVSFLSFVSSPPHIHIFISTFISFVPYTRSFPILVFILFLFILSCIEFPPPRVRCFSHGFTPLFFSFRHSDFFFVLKFRHGFHHQNISFFITDFFFFLSLTFSLPSFLSIY